MSLREEDVEPYLSFIDDLHQALRIAATNYAAKSDYANAKPLIDEYLLAALNGAEDGSGQANAVRKALWQAKQGVVPLSDEKFAFIKRRLLSGNEYAYWRQKLSADFIHYHRAAMTMGAKRNPFHGPASISSTNADIAFDRLLAKSGNEFSHLVNEPKLFYEFIYAAVEHPACSDEFGQAIRNSLVICTYMGNHRDDEPLHRLTDGEFAALRAVAARLGAWASLTAGQLAVFRQFRRILKQCVKAQTKSALLFDSVMAAHHATTIAALKKEPLQQTGFHRSRDIAKEMEDDFITETSDDLRIIYENIIRHYVFHGFGMQDRVPHLNMTVKDGINQAISYESTPAYSLISEFKTHKLRAEAHLNDGDIDAADIQRGAMATIKSRPDFQFTTIGDALYCEVAGKIEKQTTSPVGSNPYLDHAKAIFLRIGDIASYGRIQRTIDK